MTLRLFVAFALLSTLCGGRAVADEFNRSILPVPDQPFAGRIGLRPADSVKDFPKEVKAPDGAPNILLILTDDVGFGAEKLKPGRHAVTFDFVYDGGGVGKGGKGTLSVDGKEVASEQFPRTAR